MSSKTATETVDPVKEERAGKVREVGSQAIWSLSSCKPDIAESWWICPEDSYFATSCGAYETEILEQTLDMCVGFGVDQLRDDCMETYWQSDGQLPHLVNIQFRRKTTVSDICIFTDYKLDESYTPSRISIRAGTNFNDLQEVEVMDLNEPTGWVMIPIKDIHDQPIRTFMIQIAVISNHQNGRDTHMRQIKIHSPAEHHGATGLEGISQFSSLEFRQYSCIR